MPPNARFQPQNAPVILPRTLRHESVLTKPRASRFAKWGEAAVIVGIVIGCIGFVVLAMFLLGTFGHR